MTSLATELVIDADRRRLNSHRRRYETRLHRHVGGVNWSFNDVILQHFACTSCLHVAKEPAGLCPANGNLPRGMMHFCHVFLSSRNVIISDKQHSRWYRYQLTLSSRSKRVLSHRFEYSSWWTFEYCPTGEFQTSAALLTAG